MKQLGLILAVLIIPLAMLFAEGKEAPAMGWQKEIVGTLNFTQTSFSNWKQGGEDAWTWQLDINGKFVKEHENYSWANALKISYGKTKVGDADAKKAADELRLESVFTYKMGVMVNPYMAVTGETQFTDGYDYAVSPSRKVSAFFDPAYFTESAGIGYQPIIQVKTRLGVALKQTLASKFDSLYTDDPSTANKVESVRSEVGAESVTELSTKVSQNILLTSKLELFSNLKTMNQVDIRWDTMFSSQIAKYLVVSFNLKLFYDRDISIKRQLKQVLSVGLTYNLL